MTPEDAKNLLDRQKDHEQLLPTNLKEKPRNPLHPIRDW
jgi:hypothetical protein